MILLDIEKPIILYAAPMWSNTCDSNIRKIKIFENNTFRMISKAPPRTSNKDLHNKLEIKEIYLDIRKQTELFYKERLNHLSIFNYLIYDDVKKVPFKIKHKLPNSLLLDNLA